MARRPGAGREGRAGHCWGAGPALEVGWRREMPSEVEEWEEAAGGARAGAGGRGPPREALAWGLPAGARDAAALERALLGALGGDVSVCGEVPEGAGGAEGFAAGGGSAPLRVTFSSDAAAREGALLGRVEVPRAGGGPPWQVGLFFEGVSLGQPPLVLPGEPWDVCADGRGEQGGGSVARLMAAFGEGHPGDAALREEVGAVLRAECVGGGGPELGHEGEAPRKRFRPSESGERRLGVGAGGRGD